MSLRAQARVDLGAIERNAARLAAVAAPAALCAVVKADGYGHGMAQAARAAQAGGAAWLAVATAEEARELRAAGVDGPVLVMGALSPEELEVALAARADVVAWREAFVAAPAARHAGAREARHRHGAARHARSRGGDARGRGRRGRRPRLAGAMTHFATSDDDPAFMAEQLARFTPWAEALKRAHPGLLVHAANSAATLREPAARFDLVRCGIAVYGMDPFQRGSRRARPRARAVARHLRRRGQDRGAGRERRLRPPLRGRARRPGWARSRSATATACAAG